MDADRFELVASKSTSFRNHFWTAQLIAGTTMAIKMFPEGMAGGGGLGGGLLFAMGGFLFVIPFAALIVYCYLRINRNKPPPVGPQRTRWLGAIVVGLVLCGLTIGMGLLGSHFLP